MKDLLTVKELTRKQIMFLVKKAVEIKKHPGKYCSALRGKNMLMIFQKPSLRTRVSFEVGMAQMGGHAIYMGQKSAPMGSKESLGDTAKASSRYCDIIIARMFEQKDVEELAENATIPVINALTNFTHPCQILSDVLTIIEKKGTTKVRLAYLGDSNNNITHSLMYAAAILGMDMVTGCPAQLKPDNRVYEESVEMANKSGGSITITHDPDEAVRNADIIYTDSWMSYHVSPKEKAKRLRMLKKYQVNQNLMDKAKRDVIFMHDLPATRGQEMTAEVIDGKKSVVFDQAENRLHMQKAIVLWLLGKLK